VDTAAGIVILALSIVSIIVVAIAFVWAARKDGEEDRELQRRLGIRRRTRMGR
jgi:type II secretory pathway pseudopilin PulG